jgi:hypothetical protein
LNGTPIPNLDLCARSLDPPGNQSVRAAWQTNFGEEGKTA